MPDECCICLDEIVVATTGCVQLSCSHTYHLGCISAWFQKNASCPECRHKPTEKEAPPPPRRNSFSPVQWQNGENLIVWEREDFSRMTNHSDRFTMNIPPMTRGHTADLTVEQMSRLRDALLSTVHQNAATPEEIMENDVRLVSTQAEVSLDIARDTLQRCNGDVVTAIMEITLGPGSSVNVPDTFELPELTGS